MNQETCVKCRHFRVPDDGKEWGLSGVCDRLESAGHAVLVFDALGDLAEDVWELPCGAPVVRQYHYCELFEEDLPATIIGDCIKLYALELGRNP